MASDMFLQLDGVPGEAKDDKHADWIELLSCSYGVSQPVSRSVGSAGGATTGRCDIQDISFMHSVDKASPKLFELCASGKHITKATIHFNRSGGDKVLYYEIKLEDIVISSVQLGGSGGGDLPTESFSLNYGKIEIIYTLQKRADGSGAGNVTGKYDAEANKAG